ncbi:hypothetical protein [Fluviicola taffensis]|uniref:Lipoprotein n=1 Tax=Fluviicola taffensis (strain DSM 16823 / NCIMB 13979 / RW262) TaxID=755732 RepID=F2I930_FLUTR|nr:hypothetical protein [Fluviicola taffensis]AEA42977.1 hypothetical protein Fluta_0976 [Fluviicola taffensis DSM 16823]
MNKFISILSLLAIVLQSCQAQTPELPENAPAKTGETKDPRYTVTEKSFGLVKLTDNYQQVVAKYGSENVIDQELDQFESGNIVTATIVNKGKRDEFIIYWDSLHERITSIEATNPESPFRDEFGIGVGTTLEELVQINGKPITCNGFLWEFGGLITSFNQGKLKGPAENRTVSYWLELKEDNEPNMAIIGEGEFRSDVPEMKKSLKTIVVNNIGISKL